MADGLPRYETESFPLGTGGGPMLLFPTVEELR